ncbi:MAG TPA: histidine kinase, partial [Solirubrobacteraceae bacterium]|nr:histidine kinase [Solirubrobacteraceae bacterium]
MIFARLDPRLATAIRLSGLALILWSVIHAGHPPAGGGRGLLVAALLGACVLSWLSWTVRPAAQGLTPDLWVMAGAGGLLSAASPNSAASAFVFVAIAAAGLRVDLHSTPWIALVGAATLAVGDVVYDNVGVGLLAYVLGFAATALAASNSRQSVQRADQAELLLAQSQRSHEEQLRAARLEESTRIAREIHDVLAHALAGLTIQLEATSALIEQGADRDAVLARVRRAHELAREGLRETRLAIGALRGDPIAAPAGIEALVGEYRTGADAPAELTIDGDRSRLAGPTGQAILRVVQEALTNVRKHAPGAAVSVAVHAGTQPADEIVVLVDDRPAAPSLAPAVGALAGSGGGYGLEGMRERARGLGGSVSAGATADGWRVELRLPPPQAAVPA